MPSLIDENTQFTDTDGLPIVNGAIYIGTQNTDPVANPITIYSDRDLTTPISNPQSLNSYGRSSNKIWIPGKYSVQVNNSASVQKFQDLDAGDLSQTGITVLTNVQGTNTITADANPAITSLIDQQQYNFTTTGANTGAVTLQIDLTSAYPIKKWHDVDLASGDLEASQIVATIWNATDSVFEIVSNVVGGSSVVPETSDHTATPTAGFGEIWVKDETPNVPMYTDDAANDFYMLGTPGCIMMWPTATAPTGWLHCDNTDRSMTTYENLYDAIGNDYGLDAGTAFTAAVTNIITSSTHGLVEGDVIEATNSGGALPAGLAVDTKYFVLYLTTDTFSVSLALGGAAVNITDTGTGTHSFHASFKTPDLRGQFVRGWDNSAAVDPDAGSRTDRGDGTTGDNVGTKQDHELDSHNHTQQSPTTGAATYVTGTQGNADAPFNTEYPTDATGGNETRPVNIALMYIIKL